MGIRERLFGRRRKASRADRVPRQIPLLTGRDFEVEEYLRKAEEERERKLAEERTRAI